MIVPSKHLVLITASDSKQIFVFDAKTGAVLKKLRDQHPCSGVLAYLINSEQVVSVEAQRTFMTLWTVAHQEPTHRISIAERITCLTYSEKSSCLLGGSASGNLYLWETPSGLLLRKANLHVKEIRALNEVDGGYLLAATLSDIRLYSLGALLIEQQAPRPISTLALPAQLVGCIYSKGVLVVCSHRALTTYQLDPFAKMQPNVFNVLSEVQIERPTSVCTSFTSVYVGDYKGEIHVLPLLPKDNFKLSRQSQAMRAERRNNKEVLSSGKKLPITALGYIASLNYVISGSSEGQVIVWADGVQKKSMHLYKSSISSFVLFPKPVERLDGSAIETAKAFHKYEQQDSSQPLSLKASVQKSAFHDSLEGYSSAAESELFLERMLHVINKPELRLSAEVAELRTDKEELMAANLHYCRLLMGKP